jgi:hypothetical protein
MGVELGRPFLRKGYRLIVFEKKGEINVKRCQRMVKTAEWKAS